MTWAEFLIRSHAYKRQELNDWRKVRTIAYQTYVSNFYGKKGQKPKSIERYMPLDNKRKEVTDLMKQRMAEAVKQYNLDKNGR